MCLLGNIAGIVPKATERFITLIAWAGFRPRLAFAAPIFAESRPAKIKSSGAHGAAPGKTKVMNGKAQFETPIFTVFLAHFDLRNPHSNPRSAGFMTFPIREREYRGPS
jgi:hypothetical protein